ncbi:RNA polymerase sigma factor [Bacteroidia bacterium]|nr:RNA polymerase sigma factor [Bacteroidia bacterium]
MISEEELIRRCKEHDRSAQKMLFEKYANKMMAVCIRYCKNQEDAKDLLQDGYYKVFTSIKSFKGNSKIDTWMTRIFINIALNKQRLGRNKYNHYEFDTNFEKAEMSEEVPNEEIDAKIVINALNELPDIYKVVLNLYAIDGLSHKDIAKQLGISEGSSKSRLSRGRSLLNAKLKRKK